MLLVNIIPQILVTFARVTDNIFKVQNITKIIVQRQDDTYLIPLFILLLKVLTDVKALLLTA